MKQSAVDFLISHLQKSKDWNRVLNEVSQTSTVQFDLIKEAKEMEKKQSSVFENRSKLELEIIKQIDNTCRRLGYKLTEIKIEKL